MNLNLTTLLLVNRNDIHRVQVDNSLPYERIIVYISPGFMEDYQTPEYDLNYCFEKAKRNAPVYFESIH